MYNFFLPLLMGAPAAGAEAAGPGSLITSLIPFALIILIFYFLIIRPQSKKRKETEKMLSAIKKGDRIVTIGGIHGTVQSVRENSVIVKIDDNVKVEFQRSAVASVIAASKVEDKTDETEESEDSSDKK